MEMRYKVKNNKRKIGFGLMLSLLLAAMIQLSVCAANITVTVSGCVITGNNVTVTATTAAVPATAVKAKAKAVCWTSLLSESF